MTGFDTDFNKLEGMSFVYDLNNKLIDVVSHFDLYEPHHTNEDRIVHDVPNALLREADYVREHELVASSRTQVFVDGGMYVHYLTKI